MSKSNYLKTLVLMALALVPACEKEMENPSPSPEVQIVHYKATVQTATDTKATVDGLKYKFEAGDRVYLESKDGKLYGFLSLSTDGAGNNVAHFEGDLISDANFFPTVDTPINLTLVGPDDELHTFSEGGKKVTGVNYTDKSAESLEEAVRRFAHFTGSGKFGDLSYTLHQHSSFLVCALSFDAEKTPAGTSITAKIYNNSENDPIYTHTANATDVDGDIEVSWVIPFGSGMSFTNAKMTVSQDSKDDVDLKMANTSFAENTYYTFQRTTYLQNYFTIEATQPNTLVTFNYAEAADGIQYSRDGFEWVNYKTTDDPITLSQAGDYLYFRGKRTSYANNGKTNKPLITVGEDKPCYVYGDIMFLMCDAKLKPKTEMADFAFQGLFKNCTWLLLKDNQKLKLTATTLSEGCYAEMFSGCTRLTSLVGLELPSQSTALSPRCFDSMFLGCSAITAIPDKFLPWTQLAFACYRKMFETCTNLATVPATLLPAKNLARACYLRMFFGCSKLEVAPDLLATSPAPACYFAIFRNCTKIRYVRCWMYLTEEQRDSYINPDKNKYNDTADPPADNLKNWEVINAWTVFNKWLVTTSNQPLNNQKSSTFVKNPQMSYNREGYNWMGVIPKLWTVNDDPNFTN